MAHLPPRRPAIMERSGTFMELLYGDYHPSDFPEHRLHPEFPVSELSASSSAYQGLIDTSVSTPHVEFENTTFDQYQSFDRLHDNQITGIPQPFSSQMSPIRAGMVRDQHILPVPGVHSLPWLSKNVSSTDARILQSPHPSPPTPIFASSFGRPISAEGYWKHLPGSEYGQGIYANDLQSTQHPSLPDHKWETPPFPPSGTRNLVVKLGYSHSKFSMHATISPKSSKGDRFNTRFREQDNAAVLSNSTSVPESPNIAPSSNASSSTHPYISHGRGADESDVEISSLRINGRIMIPGREYECCWGSCKKTLVPCPVEGEHASNTQERFQDEIDRHIEDHIWISACGRRTRKRWECRWANCSKILGSKRALIRHIGAHSGFRVLCDRCGASYSRFDVFRRHQRKCGSESAK